jgi:hypothetical protein
VLDHLRIDETPSLRTASTECKLAIAAQPWQDKHTEVWDVTRWCRCYPAATAANVSTTRITSSDFACLRHLTWLNVSYCKGISDDAFIHVASLSSLSANGCGLLTDRCLSYLPCLEELEAAYCDKISLAGVSLPQLKILDVRFSRHVAIEALTPLTGLRKLWCTQLSDANVHCLPNSIEYLHLERCPRLTDDGLAQLIRCARLTHLSLHNTSPSVTAEFLLHLDKLQSLSLATVAPALHMAALHRFLKTPDVFVELCMSIWEYGDDGDEDYDCWTYMLENEGFRILHQALRAHAENEEVVHTICSGLADSIDAFGLDDYSTQPVQSGLFESLLDICAAGALPQDCVALQSVHRCVRLLVSNSFVFDTDERTEFLLVRVLNVCASCPSIYAAVCSTLSAYWMFKFRNPELYWQRPC